MKIKIKAYIGFFYINPYGFGPNTIEKFYQIERKSNEINIDGYLFSSTDRRWNTITQNKMVRQFKLLDQRVKILFLDSSQYQAIKNS